MTFIYVLLVSKDNIMNVKELCVNFTLLYSFYVVSIFEGKKKSDLQMIRNKLLRDN